MPSPDRHEILTLRNDDTISRLPREWFDPAEALAPKTPSPLKQAIAEERRWIEERFTRAFNLSLIREYLDLLMRSSRLVGSGSNG